MRNKIQAEGDYEAARRFNKDQQDFAKRKWSRRPFIDTDDELVSPEDLSDESGSGDITIIRRDDSWRKRPT
jgi:hypothetical protein